MSVAPKASASSRPIPSGAAGPPTPSTGFRIFPRTRVTGAYTGPGIFRERTKVSVASPWNWT